VGGGETEPTFSAITDESGSYLMKAVPVGGYDVEVVVPGFDPQILFVWVDAGRTSPADFTVYPTPEQGVGTVKGTVSGGGQLIEGAIVTLTVYRGWPVPVPEGVFRALMKAHAAAGFACTDPGGGGGVSPPWIGPDQFTTLTDQDGKYSLNVPVGTHFIECWADGYEWQGEDVTIEKHQTTVKDFELNPWTEPPPVEPGDPGKPR
jgi:hypothetical protein